MAIARLVGIAMPEALFHDKVKVWIAVVINFKFYRFRFFTRPVPYMCTYVHRMFGHLIRIVPKCAVQNIYRYAIPVSVAVTPKITGPAHENRRPNLPSTRVLSPFIILSRVDHVAALQWRSLWARGAKGGIQKVFYAPSCP